MKRTGKIFFYVRHMCLMSVRNRIRLSLTSAGIFVAVFVLAAGVILLESYYNGKLASVNEINERTVIVTADLETDALLEELAKVTSVTPVEDVQMSQGISLKGVDLSSSAQFSLIAEIHGLSESGKAVPVLCEEGYYLPSASELVSGRHLTRQDVINAAEVAVIDELTAGLLFPGEDAVGKVMGVGNDFCVEIVGVMKNSTYSNRRKVQARRELEEVLAMPETGTMEHFVQVNVPLYVPSSTAKKWIEALQTSGRSRYLYIYDTEQEFQEAANAIAYAVSMRYKKGEYYPVQTKEDMLKMVNMQFAYLKRILTAVTVILCIISGICIMSITLFSVKERIPEIGIRKAFGAEKMDILFMLVFEMVAIAAVVSVAAVCISYYACVLAGGLLSEKMHVAFDVRVSNLRLLLPVTVGLLEAVASVIPSALYAAQIRVTDALKFE